MSGHSIVRAASRAPISASLAGFVMGCALQLQQATLYSAWVYAAVLLVAGAESLRQIGWQRSSATPGHWRVPGIAWAVITTMALGFGWVGVRASAFQAEALLPQWEGQDIEVTGVVSAMPQRNEAGLRLRMEVESARLAGASVRLPRHIQLSWYSGVSTRFDAGGMWADLQHQPAQVHAGERWQWTVRLKAPHGNSNPHGFDYELWLWEQGVQATGYVRAGQRDAAPLRLEQTWRHPVELARQQVRDAILERVPDRQQAGLIAALVVGDQNAIDRADWDVFRATGVAHLMSISGLHVTMFAWGMALLVGTLWRRSELLCLALPASSAALLGGVGLAGAYAVFSGWGVPSQRTIWILATVGLLKLSGRRWPWPQVWLLAMAAIVAVDPWALLQPGFWLSFVAVGVLFATDAGADGVAPKPMHIRLQGMVREQWVITLALTPLSLLLFNQVSLVGLLVNALAIPWVTLVLTPMALSGVLWAPLWDVAAVAVAALTGVLQYLAALPLATVSVPAAPAWAALAGVAGGVWCAMPWPWRVRALGVPLLLPVLLWQAQRPPVGQFELLAADVGQGNAVLVRTAGHTLVYDAGPRFSRESDAGHRVLVPLLRTLGERVDAVVLSHRDTDHTGGARAVLSMHPQASLLSSIEDDNALQAVRAAHRCEAGQRWEWDGVQFELLHPQASDYGAARKSNAMSCVLRVGNGLRQALLVGDIEQAQEAQLLSSVAASLHADVLLVPHHGSKTSSSAAFLDVVAPRIALVQSGYRNRFGHPAMPVLERYLERHILVVDSPHCGAATWTSMWPDRVQCEREVARRYWHHEVPAQARSGTEFSGGL